MTNKRNLTIAIDSIRAKADQIIIDEAINQLSAAKQKRVKELQTKKVWMFNFMIEVPNQDYIPTQEVIKEVEALNTVYKHLIQQRRAIKA